MQLIGPRHAAAGAIVVLGGLWLLSMAVIGIAGDFPIDDDWVFARTLRSSLAAGRLEYNDFSGPLLLPQLALSSLASATFGFSFVTLRLTTLATAIGASVAMYALLRSADARPAEALFGSLALAFSPVFQSLSYTFMSDVPTVALAVVAIWSFVIAEQRESRAYLALAAIAALLAALNRQSAFALVAGFVVGHAVTRHDRRSLTESAVFLGGTVAAYLVVEALIEATVGLPWFYRMKSSDMVTAALTDQPLRVAGMGWRFIRSWTTLGLFALPVFLLHPRRITRTDLVLAGGLTVVLALVNRPMPLIGNIWDRHGVGPVLIEGLTHPGLPAGFWWTATCAAVLGAIRLAASCTTAIRESWRIWRGKSAPAWRASVQLASVVSIAALLALHAPTNAYDRYLLLVLPCAIVLAFLQAHQPRAGVPTPQRAVAWAVLAVITLFGMLAVRDSLAWQRARWQVIDAVLGVGVDPETIEGGYEFDGWTRGEDRRPARRAVDIRFVDTLPQQGGVVCATHRPIIGPQQAAICAVPASPILPGAE